MIQRTIQTVETQNQPQDWKSLLKASRISTTELLQTLKLNEHPLANTSAEKLFELRVPKPYLDKIKRGDPNDPLLLQVLPQSYEHLDVDGYSNDPLEEKKFSPTPGLIHKYQSRVLLIATQSCAIHCRYCFRRNFPYDEHRVARNNWGSAIEYIQSHPEINEVILSGGDPLVLTNEHLRSLLHQVVAIQHVKRIRLHSRLISTLPQRIDEEFLSLLRGLDTKVVIVMHCNHANEIGPDVALAAAQLREVGAVLLNQSVLLKDINDDAAVLAQLSESLFTIGVIPYYLFTLDKVHGTAHFDLARSSARQIHQKLQTLLPGYLVPRLASEIPNQPSKTLLASCN
jgi:EF-P beta-lysylation protein EpmB